MKGIDLKKELILERECHFAGAIGSAVVEKPKISLWMILLPILFLHFIYRMQKYKVGRLKFNEEFMVTRRRAMDLAVEALETGAKPDINQMVRQYGLRDVLEKPYAAWMRSLAEYYTDLLIADGDSFDAMARSAFRSRSDFLLTLNRLSTLEKEFNAVLKPLLSAAEEAADIIAVIETQSQRLRRQLAEKVFA